MRAPALIVALTAAAAWGAPLRLAVVYGHNGGDGERAPLKYAEADAARVARTLTELGGMEAADVALLQGRPVKALFAALDAVKERVGKHPEALVVVYLSAHGDASRGLLPGRERLDWKTLKERVAATGAKARVTIVDACQSSGLLEVSARVAPAFAIAAEDQLTVKGDAFITSSASAEPSLEAGVFRGSVFTQHLLAGLRGAADRSGDRRVSLEEAYRYAYERTTEGESGQHPGYGVRLSGYGELVLSTLGDERAGLLVPDGVDEVSVRAALGDERLLHARRPESSRLAVPPGDWLVSLGARGELKEGPVQVTPRAFAAVDASRLKAVPRPTAQLVRLGAAGRPCLEVAVPRPDPALQALRDKLVAAFGGACRDGQARLTAELSRQAGRVRLTARRPGDAAAFAQDSSPAESDALVRAALDWAR